MDVSSRDRPTLTASGEEGCEIHHRTSKHASTSWRSDGSPSCLGGPPHGWAPVKTHSTPVPTSVGRLWLLTNSTTHINEPKKTQHNKNSFFFLKCLLFSLFCCFDFSFCFFFLFIFLLHFSTVIFLEWPTNTTREGRTTPQPRERRPLSSPSRPLSPCKSRCQL